LSPIFFFEKTEREAEIITPKNAILSNLSALLGSVNVAFLNKSNRDTEESGIIAFVNENLTKDISITDIAAFVHLSPSQLSRVFKALTGTSVYEYILTKRLILFHEKKRQGKSAIKASSECGFHDYSAFYRLYKKRYGVSPTKKTQEN
jgi:AraC-like DNA-binding protein